MDVENAARDIGAFADSFTEVKVRQTTPGVRVEFVRGGRPTVVEIRAADGRVAEAAGKRTYASVASFLASDRMAGLNRLVETQIRASQKRQTKNRIPASIRFQGRDVSTPEISSWLVEPHSNLMRLLLLDGPAGVGKTFQIENLVDLHAREFSRGKLLPPVLHVSSKGRRLSSLRDVLSASTQDVDANFYGKHVPILVRWGLLIVAIDGFDELLDSDGYEDSWSALRQFIGEVGASGSLVLAARDTFVEDQELLKRIERSRSEVDLAIGNVLAPNFEQARQWLSASPNWKPAELDSEVTRDILKDGGYGLRPFFLRALWDAKGWAEVVAAGPRSFLVSRLINREALLIAQQVGGVKAEQIAPCLISLLQEIAVEMATREVDSIEVVHLEFLTQFSFEGVIDENSIKKLTHKVGSTALLELSADKGSRKFPHTEVQYYFLGLNLLEALAGRAAPSYLRRHLLNSDELDVFSEVFAGNPSLCLPAAIRCQTLLSSEVAADSLAPNLGALMILFMALGYSSRVDYVDVLEASFAGLSPEGAISFSSIARLDACGANVSKVVFNDVKVGVLVIDESTVLFDGLPEIGALEIRSVSGSRVVRGRQEIEGEIESRVVARGALPVGPAVTLLEKAARRAVRHFYLRASDDDEGGALLQEEAWGSVQKVLVKYGRLDVVRAKPMHGRPSALIRIKNPIALLDASNGETQKIIRELADL